MPHHLTRLVVVVTALTLAGNFALAQEPVPQAEGNPPPPPQVQEAPTPGPDAAAPAETEAEPEAETETEAAPEAEPTPAPPAAQPEAAPEPEPEPQPAPAAVPAPEPEPEDLRGRLRPPGEDALLAPHPVDPTQIRFVPGKGLEVNSEDGRFRLRTRVRVQFRWTAEDDGGWRQQLRIRRARVVFSGHTFSEDVRYKFEIAASPNDVGVRDNYADDPLARRPRRSPLLDFYVELTHLRDLQVRLGQYKVPSNRQRVISSGNLQLVDRALLNSEFTLDRDVGFDLRSRDFLGLDMLRYYLGMYIARGRDSQGFDDFGMMYLARLELLPLGMFKDYSEADFERGGPRLSLGAGWAYIDRARGDRGIRGGAPADGGTTDTQHVFADAVFMFRGLSVLTEFAWRKGHRNPGDAVDEMGMPVPVAAPRDGYGFHIQTGYLLPRLPVEVALRYGIIRGTGANTALGDRSELVAGLSYYAAQHPYKLQLDYARLWNDTIDEGEHRVRLQLQVSL